MKLAVLSDIHGNVPALEAVLEDVAQWAPDAVVVNGDVVNRGPESLEALRRLATGLPDAPRVQGNHESFVLSCETFAFTPGEPASELRRFAHWTYDQLGAEVETLRAWPDHLELTDPEGGRVHVTHGTRLGNRDGIRPATVDAELPAKLGDPRDLFITAHTHEPVVRRFGGTLIVNVGSVGAPFDQDPRSAYGRLTFRNGHWHADIRRVAFDRARTERAFHDSGFMAGAGPLARVMLTELRRSRGMMGGWMREYYDAVLNGHISLEAAVDRFLADR